MSDTTLVTFRAGNDSTSASVPKGSGWSAGQGRAWRREQGIAGQYDEGNPALEPRSFLDFWTGKYC
jgi:hypothetical protein